MFFNLPAIPKKKTRDGRMVFILPEAGLGQIVLFLHLEACFPMFSILPAL
jgi:hypothetical protein